MREQEHRAIVPMTLSMLTQILFPEGTIITDVAIDHTTGIMRFNVINAALPEVNEACASPELAVTYTRKPGGGITKEWPSEKL